MKHDVFMHYLLKPEVYEFYTVI